MLRSFNDIPKNRLPSIPKNNDSALVSEAYRVFRYFKFELDSDESAYDIDSKVELFTKFKLLEEQGLSLESFANSFPRIPNSMFVKILFQKHFISLKRFQDYLILKEYFKRFLLSENLGNELSQAKSKATRTKI